VEAIQVFASEADVPSGFEKIAVINVRGWQANSAWILLALKIQASKEGGNAIILKTVNPKGLFTYSYGTGEAIVIRLKVESR
jgi:prenyltransferase beta subunit